MVFLCLFCVSYGVLYSEMHDQRIEERRLWRTRVPPIDCGDKAPRSTDLSLLDRAVWMLKPSNELECETYIKKTSQSAWPSPILVLMQLGTQVIVTPAQTVLEAMGKGLQLLLWNHSYVAQLIILLGLALFVYLTYLLIHFGMQQRHELETRHRHRRFKNLAYHPSSDFEPHSRWNPTFVFDNDASHEQQRSYRTLYHSLHDNTPKQRHISPIEVLNDDGLSAIMINSDNKVE